MMVISGVLVALLTLGFIGRGFWLAARAYMRFRGKRLIACPETGQAAAVDLATWHIAITAAFRRPTIRLRGCSRWREWVPCDQACLRGIEAAPEECLVLTIVSKWYEGKSCICCGRPLGRITRRRHKPCVMSPDLRLFEWKDIQAENIPQVMATHAPVCWTCLVAETHTS